MRRTIRIVGALGVLLASFIYWNNAAWLADAPAGTPMLLAHRGLA